MRRILTYLFLLVIWTGCGSVYNTLDKKLYPTPVIGKEASFDVARSGDQVSITLIAYVIDAELATFLYECERGEQWIPYKEIEDARAISRTVRQVNQFDCFTRLRVTMRAYNNWQKPSMKQDVMIWVLPIAEILDGSFDE